jgi:transcriptional regulator with XRE-family HTH domain
VCGEGVTADRCRSRRGTTGVRCRSRRNWTVCSRPCGGGGGREYSYREVARAIEQHGEVTISASYLHQLRTGAKDNPTIKHVEAIASFFGVPAANFLDDEAAAANRRPSRVNRETSRSPGTGASAVACPGTSRDSSGGNRHRGNRTRHREGSIPCHYPARPGRRLTPR